MDIYCTTIRSGPSAVFSRSSAATTVSIYEFSFSPNATTTNHDAVGVRKPISTAVVPAHGPALRWRAHASAATNDDDGNANAAANASRSGSATISWNDDAWVRPSHWSGWPRSHACSTNATFSIYLILCACSGGFQEHQCVDISVAVKLDSSVTSR